MENKELNMEKKNEEAILNKSIKEIAPNLSPEEIE